MLYANDASHVENSVPRMMLRERIELSVLLAGFLAAAGLWGFVELMEVARAIDPRDFDTRILLLFRTAGQPDDPLGPAWLEEAVRDITSLGSTAVLVLIVAATIFYLLLIGSVRSAAFVLVSIGGGQMLSSLLKLGIDRPRPELVPHLAEVSTLSFPSGHAMLSAVTYLTLGVMIARIVPGRLSRIYVLGLAVLITLMVGASRIYLGVHWPSDVLAGWCAGFAWAMLCWLVVRLFFRRSQNTDK
jgi:undecaprenyl-diphosphatase